MEDETYPLPRFTSTPSDADLVEQLRKLFERHSSEFRRKGVVHAQRSDHAMADPSKLPGMAQRNRKEKYFVTECFDVNSLNIVPCARQWYWQKRGNGWGIAANCEGPTRFIGLKRTMDFYYVGEPSNIQTNWIMNVYHLIGQDLVIKHGLVLCHVFEHNSGHYEPRPLCAPNTAPKTQVLRLVPSDSSFSGAAPGSSRSAEESLDPILSSNDQSLSAWAAAMQEQLLHSDDEETSSGDAYYGIMYNQLSETLNTPDGPPQKRIKNSPDGGGEPSAEIASGETKQSTKPPGTRSRVWEFLAQIKATFFNPGVLKTWAICYHCCQVYRADSANGTQTLRNHICKCIHSTPSR